MTIEGHTDAKGADAYNQTLSEQRAASVKQWLVTNAQEAGALLACNVLNAMTDMGRPDSYAIGR